VTRRPLAALAAAALVGAVFVPAAPASADTVDVWSTYPSMSACKGDLLNDYCFGLQDGQAIGLIDATVTVDEVDQSTSILYDDENVLPAPEGPTNPVVEVWNNTSLLTFIAPGTSASADFTGGVPVYFIPPGADLTGPAVDAVDDDDSYTEDAEERGLIHGILGSVFGISGYPVTPYGGGSVAGYPGYGSGWGGYGAYSRYPGYGSWY